MRQRTSPREKKERSYAQDHVLRVEYPKSFRKAWPRKNRRASQEERRGVRRLLDALCTADADVQAAFPRQPLRREQVRKWPHSSLSLGAVVQEKQRLRIVRTAWNFFKRPYQHSRHDQPFIAFLSAITAAETPYHQELASMFRAILDQPESRVPYDRCAPWLQAFLTRHSE